MKPTTDIEKFRHYLESHRLRKTPERFEIMKCALSCSGHFDAVRLYRELEAKGYHVSKATVYHTLELLAESGLVRRVLTEANQATYERVGHSHIHLVCLGCGTVREVPSDLIMECVGQMLPGDFKPASVSITVYGHCADCKGP